MADTADDLIQRVRVALERERRTTADIAHELRTPISELLTASEVALRDVDDTRHVRRALAHGARRGLAHGPLGGHAAQAGAPRRRHRSLRARARRPLPDGRGAPVHAPAAMPRSAGSRVACLIEAGEEIECDASVLRIVVSNLVSNAVHYAPEGGRVTCRLERAGGRWRMVVENDAPELTPADLACFSEPFWRKDGSRSSRQRSGLGLALSRRLAESAGLELAFELDEGVLRASLAGREGTGAGKAALVKPRP